MTPIKIRRRRVQTWRESAIEQGVRIAIQFATCFALQYPTLYLFFDITPTINKAFAIQLIYTTASFVTGFATRRYFETWR